MTDLAALPATELLALYRAGAASPVEACHATLGRILELNGIINAFQHLDEMAALAAARASERRWRAGAPLGLLDGVPVTVKDNIQTRGWPTLSGSRTVDPDQAWSIDAPAVARLREGGAVLLGKTTMPEFAWKVMTDSPLFGITRNPWSIAHTPGGSSGGAAAATAAGMGTLALATDSGGSIRVPASRCGLVGFKPTHGRVADYPMSSFGTHSNTGPIARSVADLALTMNVIAKRDSRDWYALPEDNVDYLAALGAGIEGLRIAYSPDLGSGALVHPEVGGLTRAAAEELGRAGARVEMIDFDPDLFRQSTEAYFVLRCATQWALLRRVPVEWHAEMDQALIESVHAHAVKLDLQCYMEAEQRRRLMGARLNQLFDDFDLLICPTIHTLPEKVEEPPPEPMLTMIFNASRHPAVSVPCGLSSTGLPVGLQIVGAHYADALVLQAAACWERICGFPMLRI